MKGIILAAGYGTRMGVISKNTPKPLLPIGGKSIIEYLFEKLSPIQSINHYYIITNGKFFSAFKSWETDFLSHRNGHISLDLINDQSTSNENRLGAIGDIQFLLNTVQINEDVLITAGDNLYQFDILDYYHYFKTKQRDCICILPVNNREQLQRTGVVEVDENFQVIGFEEKPSEPKSTYACPPLYFLKAETLPLIETYLKSGQNSDAPGHFIKWLYQQRPVYAYLIRGKRYDVGNLETYRLANSIYTNSARH